MISSKELERLASLKSDEGIVSAYIRVDPKLVYDRQAHAAQFKGAVKAFARGNSNGGRRAALDRESERILKYLEDLRPTGRGVVVFACQPAGVWEVVTLDVPVPTFIDVGPSPSIELLTRVLDEHESFAVALVQRDAARIYISEQGRAEEETAIRSEVPGRHEQGGWAQARFQRHIEVHVQRHLREVVDELAKLYYDRAYTKLAVGGAPEAVDELLKMLPDPVARRVLGTFPVDFKHENDEQILDRARRVASEAERRLEKQLVRTVLEAADAGGQGAVGLDDTLRAVVEGRVRTLLVADGTSAEGAVCSGCGFLALAPATCPVCGAEPEAVPDVIERAVERAFLSGAEIETVLGDARDTLLERGGLAALLRY